MKTLLKYDWLYFIKTPRLIIFIVLPIFLSALSALSARYMNVLLEYAMASEGIEGITFPDPTVQDAYVQFYSNYSQIFMIVFVFIGVGLFTIGITKNHYPFIFTHAISKKEFLLSKIVVLISVTLVGILGGALVFAGYTYLLFETFNGMYFSLSLLMFLLNIIFVLSIMSLVSFAFKSYIAAISLSIIIYILLSSLTGLKYGVFEYFPHRIFEFPILVTQKELDIPMLVASLIALSISILMIFMSIKVFKKRSLM